MLYSELVKDLWALLDRQADLYIEVIIEETEIPLLY